MRRTALAFVALAVALVLQLSVLNGLRLPGGGVPDIVLVLVAALAIVEGPVRGMVTGFLAGLALDLAPPGSAVLGEYALVFCLVGWAAGKSSRILAKSALLGVAVLAVVVAAGETLVAGLGRALDPAQVDIDQIKHVLPYSVGYDLFITPFVLMFTIVATVLVTRERRDTLEELGAHGARSAVAGRRPHRKPQPREPRLAPGAARPHDGWVGSRPPGPAGRPSPSRRAAMPHRLRPGEGVAGSAASVPARHPGMAARPVNLRLASGRRGDGVVGSRVGAALGLHPGTHPARVGTSNGFRPRSGVPGGSAAGQSAGLLRPAWRRQVSLKFGARRGDASVGRLLGSYAAALPGLLTADGSRGTAGIRFRQAASPRYSQGSPTAPRSRRRAEPKFHHAGPVTPRSYKKAEPRFRHASTGVARAGTAGLNAGAVLDQAAVMSARRKRAGAPRLRLASGRRRDGALGGSVLGLRAPHSTVRTATPRFRNTTSLPARHTGSGKRPRFGYGRRSVLSFLAGHRIGGKWLASTRVGTRSGTWVISRRTGGAR